MAKKRKKAAKKKAKKKATKRNSIAVEPDADGAGCSRLRLTGKLPVLRRGFSGMGPSRRAVCYAKMEGSLATVEPSIVFAPTDLPRRSDAEPS